MTSELTWFQGGTDRLHYAPEIFSRRGGRWLLHFRLVCTFLLLIAMALGFSYGLIDRPVPLVIIAVIVLGYTLLVEIGIGPSRLAQGPRAERLYFALLLADVGVLTAFIYFCGGVENPAVVFYLLPVSIAGLLLSPSLCYSVATAGAVLFTSVGIFQAMVPSLHHPLPISFPGHHFRMWPFVGFVIGAVAGGVYLTAYVTTSVRSRLLKAEEHIVRNRDLLSAII